MGRPDSARNERPSGRAAADAAPQAIRWSSGGEKMAADWAGTRVKRREKTRLAARSLAHRRPAMAGSKSKINRMEWNWGEKGAEAGDGAEH